MLEPKEVRHITSLLEKGHPIPSQYKQKLFPTDHAEAELAYASKERKQDVLAETMAVPLQTVKTFGDNKGKWHNELIFGDNLQAMKSLLAAKEAGELVNENGERGVKLVYIDPPFATEREFKNSDERAYSDKVAGAEFIEFLRKRLIFIYELLAPDGALYLHLDSRKVHYMKVILDEIFGESGNSEEIIWKRTSAHSDSSSFSNVHETILFYPKSSDFFFEPVYRDYSKSHVARRYKHVDSDGRRYADGDLTAYGLKGGGYTYEWKGHKKLWRCPKSTMQELDDNNDLYYTRNGLARIKRYLDEADGLAPQDMWTDINPVNSQAEERVDYPTQKPEELLERIILSSSEKGDIVFDAFAGSGTTLTTAEKLGRKWVGIDSSKLAIYTIQKRLFNLDRNIGSFSSDNRKTFDRIINERDLNKSAGSLIVTDKARKKELVVDNQFLNALKSEAFRGQQPRDFWIVCPEEKIAIPDDVLSEDDDGYKFLEIDGTVFKFSELEQRENKPQREPLSPSPFKLLNAGLYDFARLKESSWENWRQFALSLFECRDSPHEVGGVHLDGYREDDDVLVYNHMDDEEASLDTAFVENLHEQIGDKLGGKFYIIAPAAHVRFLTDYTDIEGTRYYFLRIPYSIINELHRQDFEALTQAMSKSEVNALVNAVGFDFMIVPEVDCDYVIEPREGELIDEAVIKIDRFKSRSMAEGASQKANLEALSMIMLDFEHDEEVFDFDRIIYADTIAEQDWEIRFPIEDMGDQIMVVYMDIYGNEYRETKSQEDFSFTERSAAVAQPTE